MIGRLNDSPVAPNRQGEPFYRAGAAIRLQRSVGRLMRDLGYSIVFEMVLPNGRRADLLCLSASGGISIVEVKSSLEDFRADRKWHEYLPYCNQFYFAIPTTMNPEPLPCDRGLILADDYGAFVTRDSPSQSIAGATRRTLLIRLARCAADRLNDVADPTRVVSTS